MTQNLHTHKPKPSRQENIRTNTRTHAQQRPSRTQRGVQHFYVAACCDGWFSENEQSQHKTKWRSGALIFQNIFSDHIFRLNSFAEQMFLSVQCFLILIRWKSTYDWIIKIYGSFSLHYPFTQTLVAERSDRFVRSEKGKDTTFAIFREHCDPRHEHDQA